MNESVRDAMCCKYKKAKKDNTGQSLWEEIQSQADRALEFRKKDSRHWQLIGAARWLQPAKAYEDATCPGTLDGETPSRFLLVFFAAVFFNIFCPTHYNFAFRM